MDGRAMASAMMGAIVAAAFAISAILWGVIFLAWYLWRHIGITWIP